MVQCLILSTYCKSLVWRMDYSTTKVVLDTGLQMHKRRKRLEVSLLYSRFLLCAFMLLFAPRTHMRHISCTCLAAGVYDVYFM